MTVEERLAQVIDSVGQDRRVLVAVDGPDAAGKTTFGQALRRCLKRPAVCASIDDWHNPRETRLARGHESPEGYYLDSFDYPAVSEELLQPFAGGALRVMTGRYDGRSGTRVGTTQEVGPTAALIFDGVFLLRPELRDFWDLSIYLHVPEHVTLARATVRDAGLLGGAAQVRTRYERRYLPGQVLYRRVANPAAAADIVLDNSNPLSPLVMRWQQSHD